MTKCAIPVVSTDSTFDEASSIEESLYSRSVSSISPTFHIASLSTSFVQVTEQQLTDSQRIPKSVLIKECFQDEPSDDEEAAQQHKQRKEICKTMDTDRLNELIRRLVRFGAKGNSAINAEASPLLHSILPIGTRCLILKGSATEDVGQEAIVVGHTLKRVRVSYRRSSGRITEKLKDPKALVGLPDGIAMTENHHGVLWMEIC